MNVSDLLKDVFKKRIMNRFMFNRMKVIIDWGFLKEPDFPRSNEAAMVVHTIVNVVLLICYRKAKGLGD